MNVPFARHATWIQVFLNLVLIISTGFYTNIVTGKPEWTTALSKGNLGDFLRLAGSVNYLLLLALIVAVLSVLLTKSVVRDKRWVIRQLLEALARALIFPRAVSNVPIRATCRVFNRRKKHLATYAFYGDLSHVDPFQPVSCEGPKSKNFVIVKALEQKIVIAEDVPTGTKYPPNILVWPKLRSVLAAPLKDYDDFSPTAEVLGTISFDSSEPLASLSFNENDAKEICSISAACIYRMLKEP